MGAGKEASFYETYRKKRRGDIRRGVGRARGTERMLEGKPEEPGPGSLGITLCLERGSWGRCDRWAVPQGPASHIVAQPQDQRAERQTTTYQMRESYGSEATSWSNTPLWTADSRQDTARLLLLWRRRRLPVIESIDFRRLISYQGNQLGAGAGVWTVTDKGPVMNRTGQSCV